MGQSDLGLIFPAIIFVAIVVALSGFFVFSSNGDVNLSGGLNEPTLPVDRAWYIDGGLTTNETSYNEAHEGEYWTGAAMTIAGVICIGLLGWTGIGAVAGGVLLAGAGAVVMVNSTYGGHQIIQDIPVVNSVVQAMDFVGQGINSFGGFLTMSFPGLGGFPIFGALIGIPLFIFFFIFILRFIRGQ